MEAMATKFFVHEINPHDSAEHHDLVRDGYLWGLWEQETPAQSPHLYDFKATTAAGAQSIRIAAEHGMEHLAKKLTQKQWDILDWIGQKWTAYRGAGDTIHLNGKHVCNLATMRALERLGLALEDQNKAWCATDLGRALRKHIVER